MTLAKTGKALKQAKTWKKAFNQSGQILENSGYATTAVGTATGQPEIVAVGGTMIGVGKIYQGIGQGIKYASGGKISADKKKLLKSEIIKASKSV